MKRLLLALSGLLLAVCLCSCGAGGIFCRHQYTDEVKDSTCLEDGEKTRTCGICGKIKNIKIDKKPHEFSEWEERVKQSCTEDGVKARSCSLCGTEETDVTESLGHSYGEYVTVISPSEIQNGLMERECSVCKDIEEKVIQSINYVDTSLFLLDYDESQTYSVSSEEEFINVSNAAIFNRTAELKFTLDYEYGNLDALIDSLVDGTTLPFAFNVRAGLLGKDLTLSFTYTPEPTRKTESLSPYIQRASANPIPVTPERAADYDGFKINESVISYKVSTTEQLFYALECRVKPLPAEGSAAERIYGKIKTVLRQIINDGMTDFEKARAIYDWLIMNVAYDGALYDMLTSGLGSENSNEYNGFYLEGVFDDGVAVCDGISKAFSAMANVEGIPCVQVSGKQTGNPHGVGHAWNKIYLDGSWYIVDATSGGVIVNGTHEVYSLVYFLMTDEEMEKRYTGVDYTDLKCEREYNPYMDYKITYLGNEYDLYIESQTELNAVMQYFSSFSEEGITLQLEIAECFSVGESPMDEIQSACALAGVSVSRSLADGDGGEIITVW